MAQTYPSTSHWRVLRQSLPTILGQANYGCGPLHSVEKTWAVAIIARPPPQVLPLSNTHLSYQVLFLAPYHQNESKNLFDKLDNAATNARKHAGVGAADSARSVMVRLPETISLEACRDWAQEYVDNNPNGPIDFVMLYQPAVTDRPDGTSVIDHGFATCAAASCSAWLRPERSMNISLLVGSVSGGSRRQLTGGSSAPDISRKYLYQRGEFYTAYDYESRTDFKAQMDNLASGIFRHVVIKNESGDEQILKGIFPPQKTLSLFD